MDTPTSLDDLNTPVKPCFSESHVISLCRRLYGIVPADVIHLNGFDDQNFWIKKANLVGRNKYITQAYPDGYVLKITNSKESENIGLVEAQINVLLHLQTKLIKGPVPVPNVNGNYYSLETIEGHDKVSTSHAVKLLTFCKGDVLVNVHIDEDLSQNLGCFLFNLDECLKTFDHPAFKNRDLLFMLEKVPLLKHFLNVIDDDVKRTMAEGIIRRFEEDVLPRISELEQGLIHGDFNEHNIVIHHNEMSAILDFSDCHYAPYIFEVSIGLAYLLMLTGDFKIGAKYLKGYTLTKPLTELEQRILTTCVRARICQSVVLGLYSHSQNPENQYVLSTQKPGWDMLITLSDKSDDFLLTGYK